VTVSNEHFSAAVARIEYFLLLDLDYFPSDVFVSSKQIALQLAALLKNSITPTAPQTPHEEIEGLPSQLHRM